MARRIRAAWNKRWLLIWLTLGWCASASTYIIGWGGSDDRLRETAILAILGLAASVVLGLLGFEAVDVRRAGWTKRHRERPRSEPEGDREETADDPEPEAPD